MKKIFGKGILLVASVIFICSIACNHQEKATEAKIKAVNGGDVYNQFCVSCHGKDGKMGVSGAKDLTHSQLTYKEKIAVISNGRGGMMPYRDLLSKEEIEAVAEFIEKLKK